MPYTPNQDVQTVRVPLVLTEFSRNLNSTGSSTSSGIVGIGVVGVMIVGSLVAATKDQRLVNAIPEKITNPLTNGNSYYVSKRPGFAVLNTPASGSIGTAVHVWAGKGTGTDVISAFGTTNSTVYNTTSSLGSTTGKVISITDTLVGSTANLVMVTSGGKAYFYPEGGALTEITDVDFPGNAGETITGNFVFIDGFSFIMTTSGKIYNSDINSISSWTAGSYMACNMSPDLGIGLARYKDFVMAFGKESTELYTDVGNATGSPLQRDANSAMFIGCVNNMCYAPMDDTVVWLGSTAQSGVALYMMDGKQPKRLSTPVIESLLASSSPSGFTLNCIKLVGKSFVVINSSSDLRTYVYCMEDDMWHEWGGTAQYWQHMHGIATGVKNVYAVTEQSTSGSVYIMNPTAFVFQDSGINYSMYLQTNRFDAGNQMYKTAKKTRLIGDMQASTANVSVVWSDDDYQTSSTARTVDMSKADNFLSGCGQFKRRSFALTYTGSLPMRLEALELDISQGSH